MKPFAPERNVTAHLPNEVNSFSIKATGKAFQTLVASLYSDKITAVLREIGSNAYDSHVAAGIPDTPFEVHLPGTLSPVLRIRDFGTGMTHEQIVGLYSTLFDSSKEDTNEQVGFLGLGSKSPFAYTDAFSVHAYDGETKRTYALFLSSELVPQISLLTTVPCSEPRGFEVSITVKKDDYTEVQQKAATVFDAFAVRPTVDGRISPAEEVLDQGETWKIVRKPSGTGAYDSGVFVQQGCVRYPVNTSYISPDVRRLTNHRLVLIMPIGSVSVTPSRESLSYDTETVSNMRAAVDRVIEDMRARVQAEVDKIRTLPQLQRAREAQKIMGAFNSFLIPDEVPEWTSLKLGKKSPLRSYTARYGFSREPVKQVELRNVNGYEVWVLPNPVPRGFKARLDRYLGGRGQWNYKSINVVHTPQELRRVVRVLGLQPHQVKSIHDLPELPKREKVDSSPRDKTDPLSKFYTLDDVRLKLSEVPKDFFWVTKTETKTVLDKNGKNLGQIWEANILTTILKDHGIDAPVLVVTRAGASGSPSAGKGYLPPDKELDISQYLNTYIPAIKANQLDSLIAQSCSHHAREALQKKVREGKPDPIGDWATVSFAEKHLGRPRFFDALQGEVDALRDKYPMCFPLDSEAYMQYIESIDNNKE